MKSKTLFAAFAACLALGNTVQAATINFGLIVGNGVYAGTTGAGSVTFDDTLLTGSGFETLGSVGGSFALIQDPMLTISITLGSVALTANADAGYPDFPVVAFQDGLLSALDFAVNDGLNGVELAQFGVRGASIQSPTFDASGAATFVIDVGYLAVVPLPASAPMLLGALALGTVLTRRRNAA